MLRKDFCAWTVAAVRAWVYYLRARSYIANCRQQETFRHGKWAQHIGMQKSGKLYNFDVCRYQNWWKVDREVRKARDFDASGLCNPKNLLQTSSPQLMFWFFDVFRLVMNGIYVLINIIGREWCPAHVISLWHFLKPLGYSFNRRNPSIWLMWRFTIRSVLVRFAKRGCDIQEQCLVTHRNCRKFRVRRLLYYSVLWVLFHRLNFQYLYLAASQLVSLDSNKPQLVQSSVGYWKCQILTLRPKQITQSICCVVSGDFWH